MRLYDQKFARISEIRKINEPEAHRLIVEQYGNLVWRSVNKYASFCKTLSIGDLYGHGIIGLFEAVEHYDPKRKVLFSYYCTYYIASNIQAGILEGERMIRLPAQVAYDGKRIDRSFDILAQNLRRLPTPEELAASIGLSIEATTAGELNPVVNIDPKADLGSWPNARDPLTQRRLVTEGPQADIDRIYFHRQIVKTIHTLPQRHRAILLALVENPDASNNTLRIAVHLKSCEGARQRIFKAKAALRDILQSRGVFSED